MAVAIITGSAGLVGSEAVRRFAGLGMDVVGIDNDMRSRFFGAEASTEWNLRKLMAAIPGYRHHEADIRDPEALRGIFARYGRDISLVIHTAAQPSHDWAATDPQTDFTVNAVGTLNLLCATRTACPEATFIFTSTNKVYGDLPNSLPLVEQESRWELEPSHPWANGIPESMSIDQSMHSLFGASKVSADILVQEFGRYFGMNTGVFRGGCLTGPNHSGAMQHGFLAYLMKCAMIGTAYTLFGYKGKQVRDNIHSADLVAAFQAFHARPSPGAVYNIGGGRESNCSVLEAIRLCGEISGREVDWTYSETARNGDHIWYISDLSRFKSDYPDWSVTRRIPDILREIHDANSDRWKT